MPFRYNLTMNDNIPAGVVGLYSRGAIVNGDQAAVNAVTVHETHDFQIGHRFLYALSRSNILTSRVFTVTGKSDTTVTFSGAPFSFTDGVYLVPLGPDSGGVLQSDGSYTQLQWDGSTVDVFSDGNGDDAYDAATVSIEPGGEVGFWSETTELWGIVRTVGGRPLRLYILNAVAATMATDTIWEASGDLAVGSGTNTAARLAIGDPLEVLRVNTLGNVIEWAAPHDISDDPTWSAKGQLIVATANNAAAVLPVQTDGDVLTCASGEATGLAWVTPTPYVITADTFWDAKGQMVAGTGADTATGLAVGANGFHLIADDTQTTGLSWGNAARLLSTTNVSFAADADTTLYTVPAGKRCVLESVVVVAGADAGATTTISVGQNGSETDFIPANTLSNLDAANDCVILRPIPNTTPLKGKSYAAATVIQAQVANNSGGATNAVYLFGFTY